MYILCSGKASIMGIYIDRNRILRVVEHLREEKTSQLTGKKITLTDQIYQDIKEDISSKIFQPGEKLNIKELARKYNVSDTPVKQALQRLADEKMVISTPNKGMSVRALTPHELNDIFDIRLMMDTFFVKDIVSALNYNAGLRQQLVDNLESMPRGMNSAALRSLKRSGVSPRPMSLPEDRRNISHLIWNFTLYIWRHPATKKLWRFFRGFSLLHTPQGHMSTSPIRATANV